MSSYLLMDNDYKGLESGVPPTAAIAEAPVGLGESAVGGGAVAPLPVPDVIVLLVDHKQFKSIPQSSLARAERVDTRGIWN